MSTPLPPAVQTLLAYARSQLGIHEDPPGSNRTKFSPWPRPWCADFVSHCFRAIGHRLPMIDQPGRDGFAGCPAGLEHFRVAGWVVTDGTRLPGDVVFLRWKPAGPPAHVEIITGRLPDGRLETIGGNTGRRSDSVAARVRSERHVVAVVRVPTLWTNPDDPCWKRPEGECPV